MGNCETTSPFGGRRRNTAVIGVLCAVMLLACPLGVAIDNGEIVEETDANPLLIAGAIFVITFVVTYAASYLASNWGSGDVPDGGDQSEVNAAFRQAQAELLSSNYGTASGMWSQLALNDAQLWSFVESFFDLQAETAAAYLWSDTADYDGDKILEESSLIYNSLIYNYNLTSAWNEFTASWSDYRNLWAEKGEAYDSMELGYGWDSGTWTGDGVFSSELMRYATPTTSSYRVYLDVVGSDEEGYSDRTNIMYSVGGSGALTSLTTGATTELREGQNDLEDLGLTSGWYELEVGPTYLSQNMSGSVSHDGLMPGGCLLLRSGDGYAFVYESGDSLVVVRNGQSIVTDTLTMTVSYDDQNGNRVDDNTVDLKPVVMGYDSVVDALNEASRSANYAGEVAWNLYDAIGESSALLKPSSITSGTQTEVPLTAQQASLMYLAAMEQIAELGTGATSEEIRISPESMDLYCYGDIYFEGALIAEDAVYTPFVYDSTEISVGQHDMDVNGMAMVWATGVPSLESWDGSTDGGFIVDISGCNMDTANIVHNGTEVSSVELTVDSMERLGLIGFTNPGVPDVPKTVDIVPLVQIIIILIGAIVAIAGLFVRNPWLIVIGIVVAVAGYFLAGFIAGLVF